MAREDFPGFGQLAAAQLEFGLLCDEYGRGGSGPWLALLVQGGEEDLHLALADRADGQFHVFTPAAYGPGEGGCRVNGRPQGGNADSRHGRC
jgi:hypothetical protein